MSRVARAVSPAEIPAPADPALEALGEESGYLAGAIAYLGGLGMLGVAAIRATIWPLGPAPAFYPTTARQLDRFLMRGVLVVALVQASLGAFLALQAFFNATFRDASGAVVGLGMLKNLGSLVSGWTLAALLAASLVPELRRRNRTGLDDDPLSLPDRDVARGLRDDPRPAPEPARLAATRIAAAAVAGPILALWGTAIGMLFGMTVSRSLLGVEPGNFVGKFLELLEPFDVVGLAIKGVAFGVLAGLAACHEGLRGGAGGDEAPGPDETAAVFRAGVVALVAILVLNSTWFTLVYLAGAPYGPAAP
jgi:phospholipid/cholesterol/gamma-HCH transport system permease protein